MKNENQENEYRTMTIPGILAGLLVGSLAGAVTMLLLAPRSGKRTREKIQQKSIELIDQAGEVMEDTINQVRLESKKFAKDGREKAKEIYQQGQALVAEQIENVSDAARAGKKAILSS